MVEQIKGETPSSALVEVTFQEALDCLDKVLFDDVNDKQCVGCEFNEFCSGALEEGLLQAYPNLKDNSDD